MSLICELFHFRKYFYIVTSLRRRRLQKRFAVIICGGPSFDSEVSEYLKSVRHLIDVFALNFYCENSDAENLIPEYYVLSDPVYLNPPPDLAARSENLFHYIRRHKIKTIVPFSIEWCRVLPAEQLLYFNDVEVLFLGGSSPIFPRGYRSNTSFKAIAVASYFKYEKMFVVGLDFNYPNKVFVDVNGNLLLRDEHHYGEYITDYSQVFDSIGHALNWWSYDYIYLKTLFQPNIINVSDTSLIDTFARMSVAQFKAGVIVE